MNDDAETWRFLDTGKGSAMFNMALDTVLFEKVRHGGRPFVRLYRWEQPSITIGFSQKASELFDTVMCSRDHIDVVTRPTGGRAVYHDCDVAYSVSAATDDPVFGGTIAETFIAIGEAICKALGSLGVKSEINPGAAGFHERLGSGAPCFMSVSRYELTTGGKKIAGGAQRRIGEYFLQQGSVLIGSGQSNIALYLKDRSASEMFRDILTERSTDIGTETGEKITENDLIRELKKSFYHILAQNITDTNPEPSEIYDAQKLIETFRSGRE